MAGANTQDRRALVGENWHLVRSDAPISAADPIGDQAAVVLRCLPVVWVWAGTTFYADRFDPDDALHRGLVALQMVAVCALALSLPDALGDTSRTFALSSARVTLLLMDARAHFSARGAGYDPLVSWYIKGYGLAALIWLVSAFVPEPARFYFWAVALVVDLGTPLSMRRLQVLTPLDRSHLSERFGLFVIIVLGEAVVGVVAALAGLNLDTSTVIGALFCDGHRGKYLVDLL